jgi:hypothetical protein
MRSNLMDAIRKAGGAEKLKSSARVKHTQAVKEQQKEKAPKQAASSGGGGGDLMADLFNKLAMRRKVCPQRYCTKCPFSSAYSFAGYFGC